MNKTKVRKRNSNSVPNTQIWKNKLLLRVSLLQNDCWPLLWLSVCGNLGLRATDCCAFQLEKQTKPQKEAAGVPAQLSAGHVPAPAPTPHPMGGAGPLPVKDTVSSWEQDFMEDHFCHDAPDRPDVHYQTPGG